jgi:hypothetical protein
MMVRLNLEAFGIISRPEIYCTGFVFFLYAAFENFNVSSASCNLLGFQHVLHIPTNDNHHKIVSAEETFFKQT